MYTQFGGVISQCLRTKSKKKNGVEISGQYASLDKQKSILRLEFLELLSFRSILRFSDFHLQFCILPRYFTQY